MEKQTVITTKDNYKKGIEMKKPLLVVLMIMILVSNSYADEIKTIFENEEWKIWTSKNEATNEVSTYISSKPFMVSIFKEDNNTYLAVSTCDVSDIEEHEGPFIKVDNNKAFTVKGPNVYVIKPSLIEQMKTGETLNVKDHCFYGHSPIVPVPLEGFTEAYDKFIELSKEN